MKVRGLLFGAIFALSGCVATQEESIIGPSGQAMQQVKCNGSPNGCLKQANQICKGPYQVLDSSSNAGGAIADLLPGPVTWYRMSFACGKTDGRMPSFPFRGQNYTPAPVIINQTAPSTPRTTNCSQFGSSISCTTH
ncbi:hypothetical protein [Aureimonas altamirensis]|uniref:hypothetical protein n=1 Tax=Aureimonas altamirensis TaxID=370622 RepID=UPI003016D3B3